MGCSGRTAARRLRAWEILGVWARLHADLLGALKRAGKLDANTVVVDGVTVRAFGGGEATGPSPVDRSRKGLIALRTEAFEESFAAWVRSLRDAAAAEAGVERPTLAIDGKTMRRSYDNKNGLVALHSVIVWESEYGLSLGPVA